MRSINRPFFERIDYLRGICALWVCFYHGIQLVPTSAQSVKDWVGSYNPIILFLSQGWLAISIFIMTSGFCLGYGLKDTSVDWKKYFVCRFLRIAPLYYFLIFVALLGPSVTPVSPVDVLSSFTMLPIPGSYSPSPWLGVCWSIKLEWLLYIVVPALCIIPSQLKNSFKYYLALGFIFLFALLHLAKTDPIIVYYNGFPSRLLEFVIGFYIGYFKVDIGWQNSKKYFGIIGALLFFILTVELNRLGGWYKLSEVARLSATSVSIIASLALLQWAIKQDTINNRMSSPSLRLIMKTTGKVSYSIYMIHFAIIYLIAIPIYNIAKNYFSEDLSLLAAIIMLGFSTISISMISYNLIERPFLKYRPKYLFNEEKPGTHLL